MNQDKSLNDVCGMCCGILKPKFRLISNVLGGEFAPPEGTDVFIDLNTAMTVLMGSNKVMTKIPFTSDFEMTLISNIFGIILHWKRFMRRKANTRIFAIVNDPENTALAEKDVQKTYLSPYTTKMAAERNKQFVYYWKEAIKKVEIILHYIPSIYLINCDKFDSYVVPNLPLSDQNDRYKIIVTGNAFFTNYVNMPKTYVFYSRYTGYKVSQLTDPAMIVQAVSKIDEDIMATFIKNRVFYDILSAIIGDFDRGIIGISQYGITSFAADLLRAYERHEIPEDPSSLDSVLPALKSEFHDYLKKAYQLVDIPTHTKLIKPSMIEKVKSRMIDLYDLDGLAKIQVRDIDLLEFID